MSIKKARPVALVTGGRRGIGLAVATRLALDGFDIAITGRQAEDTTTSCIVAGLCALKAKVLYVSGDIADVDDHRRVLDTVENHLGPVAVLVSNAGIAPPQRRDVLDVTCDSFDRVLDANLRGAFFFAQATAKNMLARSAGEGERSIIFVTSCSAEMISTNRLEYCVSKAGLSMVAHGFAARLAPEGIGVFEVRPGIIRTDMTAGVDDRYSRLIGDGLVPARRWGTGEDIAAAVAMLVKKEAFFATGSMICADGGLTLPRL